MVFHWHYSYRLFLIFILYFIEPKRKYEKYDRLWILYDQHIKGIKENMGPITNDNENFYWWELKDLSIEDQEYQQILNNLVSDVRMCYLEFTDNGELYTNSNPIRHYRNKKDISKKELEQLSFQMNQENCLTRFEKYSSLLISEDEDKRNRVLDQVQLITKNRELFKIDDPTYLDLFTGKILEVSSIDQLSSWLRKEYYDLK